MGSTRSVATVTNLAGLGLAIVIALSWATRSDASIYWADFNNGSGSTLGRTNPDNTALLPAFITGASGPCGVAVNETYVYWANFLGPTNILEPTIGRATKGGSGVDQFFISVPAGDLAPCGVAVDSHFIYWANTGFGSGTTVGRANLDGSNPIDFIAGGSGPCGVAVDGQHIYWANNASGTIGRANLDGTDITQDFIPNAGTTPCGVAVDGSHIYWANSFGGSTIGRANLDGSDVQPSFISDLPSPCGVAVGGGFIYWAEVAGGAVGRASLDGSNVQTDLIPTSSSPCGVALDPPAGSTVPVASAFGLMVSVTALLGVAARALLSPRKHHIG